jgi:hypothetical protein
MPTQPEAFLTPKRTSNGHLRTKISAVSRPKTFQAITRNLLRVFSEDAPTMTPTADINIPDFSRVKFPTNMTAENKKEIENLILSKSYTNNHRRIYIEGVEASDTFVDNSYITVECTVYESIRFSCVLAREV